MWVRTHVTGLGITYPTVCSQAVSRRILTSRAHKPSRTGQTGSVKRTGMLRCLPTVPPCG